MHNFSIMKYFLLLTILFSSMTSAQTTIYLVRHAEKQAGDNPALTAIGEFRAQNIAKQLASVGINHIFSTDYKRTQQTAKPLADFLKLPIQSYDPRDLTAFAEQLKSLRGSILVVGHSNTTPELTALLSQQKIDEIKENEYDNLYQVILVDDKIILNHLRTIPSYLKLDKRPLHNSGTVEKRMKNTPIKAKNESNSPLFANFLTQSGVFYNFLTRSTSCAKVSIIKKKLNNDN